MDRDDIYNESIEAIGRYKCVILELATGVGKSRLSIEMARKCVNKDSSLLILIAKKVHKTTWEHEINKWGGLPCKVRIECYESLKKVDNRYDVIIADEAHHMFTDLRIAHMSRVECNKLICLSATMPKDLRSWLCSKYITKTIKYDLQDAIDGDVLPDPSIFLIPLKLGSDYTETIIKEGDKTLPEIQVKWEDRHKYLYAKGVKNTIKIRCSQIQYNAYISDRIDWLQRKGYKFPHLKACSDRLKWLSEIKEVYTKDLLHSFHNYRTLTFCSTIEQTERLGYNCINSKNRDSESILKDFNTGKIDHITACQMLNEGVNLVNCRVGIYNNINASERINIQKFGRLLRHKKPIVVIPYFENTRESEIVDRILQGFNKDHIWKVEYKEFKKWVKDGL